MLSSRPYLIRAIYEWISGNGLTPYLLVDALQDGSRISEQHVEEGKIILNISSQAVKDLQLGNEWIIFSACFDGKSMEVSIPTMAVLAIYARENGQGMVLDETKTDESPVAATPVKKSGKPHLELVK